MHDDKVAALTTSKVSKKQTQILIMVNRKIFYLKLFKGTHVYATSPYCGLIRHPILPKQQMNFHSSGSLFSRFFSKCSKTLVA